MRERTCCFTGHRDLPQEKFFEIQDRTIAAIRQSVAEGYRYFGVGGAVGFDTLAANALFQLRETEFRSIKVILVYPFEGFTSRWTDWQKADYARMLPQYDKVVCVGSRTDREAYLARDRHLVDGSSLCICYCTRSSGGTAYTVRYAKEQGVRVHNIAGFNG